MAVGDIDIVEEVAVVLVIELSRERLSQMLGTCPQDLIGTIWRPLRFPFHHALLGLR
jgi:hypothetical protein